MKDIVPEIREATAADAYVITDMCLSLKETINLEEGISNVSLNNREEILAYISNCLADNSKIFFVAQIEDEVAGFIEGEIKRPHPIFKPQMYGNIACLFIKKPYWDLGISRMLIFRIEEWFKDQKIKTVQVIVRAKNIAGKNLWNSLGYNENSTILKKDI